MSQHYSLKCYKVATLLDWVNTKQMVIPEIQRPFVWNATQVRDFIDSLYHGYPVGYLIIWFKSGVPVRRGSQSGREYLLIDGQQRMMALLTALLGKTVFNKKYDNQRIKIAFRPSDEKFEVAKASHERDPKWISDISVIFSTHTGLVDSINSYCCANPGIERNQIDSVFNRLAGIRDNSIGVVKLKSSVEDGLDGEAVADIFNRINSTGVRLTSPDFIMSKMAAIERHNSQHLRKSIDYFCHLAAIPTAYNSLKEEDEVFANTRYFAAMQWLSDGRNNTNGLYVPNYADVLRVVFTLKFKHEDLGDLVDYLSNTSAEENFLQLENGILNYMNQTNFNRFVMALQSAGFVKNSMVTARNAVNSAYILYLALRAQGINHSRIEGLVRQWFVMSVLTGRYSQAPQATFGEDIRGITTPEGITTIEKAQDYLKGLKRTELSNVFWDELPRKMRTSTTRSVYFNVFLASQVKQNDKGFLSRDETVGGLLRGEKHNHHIFPKNYLHNSSVSKKSQNQIANLVVMQGDINENLGDEAPATYFSKLQAGCRVGEPVYGTINNLEDLQANFDDHCIPFDGVDVSIFEDYNEFLEKRRELMAKKIKGYYYSL